MTLYLADWPALGIDAASFFGVLKPMLTLKIRFLFKLTIVHGNQTPKKI
ncbi:hypothetical protein JCM19300_2650 [Algibacter lectus]|uniref:Uncharacterized protein n=1 Tax=Algibacter lectus TaxID=221126 RepID=A0A090WBI2_9FLAO|nr:hypothetical protein JCM19300_2650 [Algibacter lectus]